MKKQQPILQVITPAPKVKLNGIHKNGKAPKLELEEIWKIGQNIPLPPADLPGPTLSENAVYIGKTRYAKRDAGGNPIEDSKGMFWRVAYNIAVADLEFGASEGQIIDLAREFYGIMASQSFIPNTPTMLNAGKRMQQLSACFVLPIEDDLQSIGKTVVDMIMIHKSGGGTGFSFSRLRPMGDVIGSSGGTTMGPTSFLQAYNDMTSQIKQGGVRRGANMGILHITHPDVLRFAVMKVDEFSLTNFNISVTVTEEWMEQVKKDEKFVESEPDWEETIEEIKVAQTIRDVDLKLKRVEDGVKKLYDLVRATHEDEGYELINPRNGEVMDRLNAKKVFLLITQLAWHYGDPGMIMIDRINKSGANPTPHLGMIEATNPCVTGDTWIHTSEGPKQVYELVGNSFKARINGHDFPSTEKGFFETGEKQAFSLQTKEGYNLRLTSDHKIKRVTKLSRYLINSEWTEAANLKSGDKIVLNNNRTESQWQGNYTFTDGYFMGLLIGDGTLKTDKAVLSVWIPQGSGSGSVMLEVSSMIKATTDAKLTTWISIAQRNEYRLSNAYIKSLAKDLGMSKGNKTITGVMEKASSEFNRGLLRGLFDADGSVQGSQVKGVSVRLSQSNLSLLQAAQRILLRLGIASCIYKNRRQAGYKYLPNGKGGLKKYPIKAQHELVISGDNLITFQDLIGFKDSVKAVRLQRLLKNYKRTLNRERFVATIDRLIVDGEETVFDAQIMGINAFDTNGIIAHNCGEQPLLGYDACTLGSINVGKYVTPDGVDYEGLKEISKQSIHFLDNVLEMNNYPIAEIAHMTRTIRRVGLGVMGFADALYTLGIGYNTPEGRKVAEDIMECIQVAAKEASVELAKVRGVFPAWDGSIYDPKGPYFLGEDIKVRNGARTTIAPTGTISMLADASSGIEPIFGLIFAKNTIEGKRLFTTNPLFAKIAKEEGFYSEELQEKIEANHGSVQGLPEVPEKWQKVFVTSHDIAPEDHVLMQAAFQKYVDNAISKTINFPHEATVEDVRRTYLMVYETGCKGITIYRDGSREKQVLETKSSSSYYDQLAGGSNFAVGKATEGQVKPDGIMATAPVSEESSNLGNRPAILRGRTYRMNTPVGEAFITINRDSVDNPFEVFVTIGKAGMHTSADAEAIGRLISLALRVSGPNAREIAGKVVQQLKGIGGASHIGFGKDRVMSLADAIAKALAEELNLANSVQEAEQQPLNLTLNNSGQDDILPGISADSYEAKHADLCPECGNATFILQEGCQKCFSCGYSKC